MKPRLTRRNLLVGGAAAAALPTGLLVSHAASHRSGMIVAYLQGQFPGLAVSRTNMEGFAKEFLSRNVGKFEPWYFHETIFLMLANPSLLPIAPAGLQADYEKFTRNLVTKFLLSTDFFGAGNQRPERTSYFGYADPYASTCSNPLAQPGSPS